MVGPISVGPVQSPRSVNSLDVFIICVYIYLCILYIYFSIVFICVRNTWENRLLKVLPG